MLKMQLSVILGVTATLPRLSIVIAVGNMVETVIFSLTSRSMSWVSLPLFSLDRNLIAEPFIDLKEFLSEKLSLWKQRNVSADAIGLLYYLPWGCRTAHTWTPSLCQQIAKESKISKTYLQLCHSWHYLTEPLEVLLISGDAYDTRTEILEGGMPSLANEPHECHILQTPQFLESMHDGVQQVLWYFGPTRPTGRVSPACLTIVRATWELGVQDVELSLAASNNGKSFAHLPKAAMLKQNVWSCSDKGFVVLRKAR